MLHPRACLTGTPLLLEQVCEGHDMSDWILVSVLLLFAFAIARLRPAAACHAVAVTRCPWSFTFNRMLLYLSQKLHPNQSARPRAVPVHSPLSCTCRSSSLSSSSPVTVSVQVVFIYQSHPGLLSLSLPLCHHCVFVVLVLTLLLVSAWKCYLFVSDMTLPGINICAEFQTGIR